MVLILTIIQVVERMDGILEMWYQQPYFHALLSIVSGILVLLVVSFFSAYWFKFVSIPRYNLYKKKRHISPLVGVLYLIGVNYVEGQSRAAFGLLVLSSVAHKESLAMKNIFDDSSAQTHSGLKGGKAKKETQADLFEFSCNGPSHALWLPFITDGTVEEELECIPVPSDLNVTRHIFVTSLKHGVRLSDHLTSPLSADCLCQGVFRQSKLSETLPEETRFGAFIGTTNVQLSQRYFRSAPLRWAFDNEDFVPACGPLPDFVEAKDANGMPVPETTTVWTGASYDESDPLGYNLSSGEDTCMDWTSRSENGAIGLLNGSASLSWLAGGVRECKSNDVQLLCVQQDPIPTTQGLAGCPMAAVLDPVLLWGVANTPMKNFEKNKVCNADDNAGQEDPLLPPLSTTSFTIPVIENDMDWDPPPPCDSFVVESTCGVTSIWQVVEGLSVVPVDDSTPKICTLSHSMEDDELKEFASSDRQFRIVLPLKDDFNMEDDIDMRCPIALFTAETCPLGFMFGDANADYPCKDIDECTTSLNVCRAGEQCLNEMGGFKCLPPEPEPIFPTSQPDGQCSQQIISDNSVQAAFAVAIADTTLTFVVPALSASRCPAGTRADRPSLLHVINRSSLSSPWTLEQTLHLGEQEVDSDRSCDVEHVLGVSLSFSSDGQSLLSGTQERPAAAGNGSNEKVPGVAVIFDRVGNGLPYDSRQTLIPSTASNFGDGYGSAVCLSADGLTAAVGAPRGRNNSGRLVIFSRSEQGGEFTQLQDLGEELVGKLLRVSFILTLLVVFWVGVFCP